MRAMTRALITVVAILVANSAVNAEEAIRWMQSLEQAQAEAIRQNKPVLVHFWSYSCAPCMKLDRYVFNNAEVGDAVLQSVIPVKINVDQNPDLARDFGITRIPTDIFLAPNGNELQRRTSPGNARTYIELVRNVAATSNTAKGNGWQEVAQAARASGNNAAMNVNADARGFSQASQNTFQGQAAQFVPGSSPNDSRANNSNFGQTPNDGSWDGYAQNQRPVNNAWSNPPNNYVGAPAPPAGQFQAGGPAPDRSQMIVNQQFNPGGAPPWQGNAGQHTRPSGGNAFNPQPSAASYGANSPPDNGQISNPYVPPSRPAGSGSPSPSSPLGYNPSAPPKNQFAPAPRAPTSEFAMEGYCPVTLRESKDARQAWKKGDSRFGAVHRGRTFLFAGPDEQRKFLERPDYYSPVLSCYDPVRFADGKELIEGKRQHGVFYRGQVFLFADEATLRSFWQNPNRYSTVVYEAMRLTPSDNQRR